MLDDLVRILENKKNKDFAAVAESNTLAFYRNITEKLDDIAIGLKNVDISSILREILPLQNILSSVKPIYPTNKNFTNTPVIPVRNISDLENGSIKTDEKETGTLAKLSNVVDKFRDVKQQPVGTALASEGESFLKTKSRIEEDEDSIAADVKGIHNLLKKFFGDVTSGTKRKNNSIFDSLSEGEAPKESSSNGLSNLLLGGAGAVGGYALLKKYSNRIKGLKTLPEETKLNLPQEKMAQGRVVEPNAEVPKLPAAKPSLEPSKLKNVVTDAELVTPKSPIAEASIVKPNLTSIPAKSTIADILKPSNLVKSITPANILNLAKGGAVGAVANIGAEYVIPKANEEKGGYWAEVANNLRESGIAIGSGAAGGTAVGGPFGTVLGAIGGGTMDIGTKGYRAGKELFQTAAYKDKSTAAIEESNITLTKRKEESNAKAKELGFENQEEQVRAIKAGTVKPNESKPVTPPSENVKRFEEVPSKTINLEPVKEESLKDKTNTKEIDNSGILDSIDENTKNTHAGIQGLTAGIYRLAEAIARGGDIKPSTINFNPIIQGSQPSPGPLAADYAQSYSSPGQSVRQKHFKSYNGK